MLSEPICLRVKGPFAGLIYPSVPYYHLKTPSQEVIYAR